MRKIHAMTTKRAFVSGTGEGVGGAEAESMDGPSESEDDMEVSPPDDDELLCSVERSSRGNEWQEVQPYLRQMMGLGLLTREEEVEVITVAQTAITPGKEAGARKQARDRIVYCNIRSVLRVVPGCMNRGLPLLDLIQEGIVGMVKAIDRFEMKRKLRFSTYAVWWIRHAIWRALKDQDVRKPMRIPEYAQGDYAHLKKVEAQFRERHDREPNDEELLEALRKSGAYRGKRMTLDQVGKLRYKPPIQAVALDGPVVAFESEMCTFGELIADPTAETDAPTTAGEMAAHRGELLRQAWTLLQARRPERMAEVLHYRFGLGEHLPMKLREIADLFMISCGRVAQIEQRAMQCLMSHFKMTRGQIKLLLSAGNEGVAALPNECCVVPDGRNLDALAILEEHAPEMPSDEWKWRVPAPVQTLMLRGSWPRSRAEAAVEELIAQGHLRIKPQTQEVFLVRAPTTPNRFGRDRRRTGADKPPSPKRAKS